MNLLTNGEIKVIIVGLIGLILLMIIPIKPLDLEMMKAEMFSGRNLVCKDK